MTAAGVKGSRIGPLQWACGAVLVSSFLLLVPLQRAIDGELAARGNAGELLYLPSGRALRRLSLGHEGLLADIYWTRVVQYYGRKRLSGASRFDLLGPLLRITTELDPQLVIAYRFGAIFLAEKAPAGAGQPEEALQLLRRGIVANPDYWRLWQDLGFIYYWDLKDYESAARAFRVGSERPGAQLWMKAMAASVAARGGAAETSRLLWSEIYRQADNEQIRVSAENHLRALQAQQEIESLNALLREYRQAVGHPAHSFRALVEAGFLRAQPRDPSGAPYHIGPDGLTTLAPGSKVDLRLLQ
jgi:tetratricopeptide (TPR) repeat protein